MTHSKDKPAKGDSPLFTAIESLRADVQRLVDSSWSKEVRFEVPEIKLELELVAQETKGAKGELGVTWLPVTVKVGGEGTHTETRTHRLSLTLRPKVVTELGELQATLLSGGLLRRPPMPGIEGDE